MAPDFEAAEKCRPRRLKPDSLQSNYVRPKGRTLRFVPAPDFQSGGAGFQTRGNARHTNFRALALMAAAYPMQNPAARSHVKSMPSQKDFLTGEVEVSLQGSDRRGFIPMQGGVLGDAHHGEDLLKMGSEPERGNRLIRFAGFHQHLDNQGNSTRIDVFHFGEVNQHRTALNHTLVSA